MIKKRLNVFIVNNCLLQVRFYAYQKHKSSSICINDITHFIARKKSEGNKVVMLFLDINKAYDCVDLQTLNNIFILNAIPKDIAAWIFSEEEC